MFALRENVTLFMTLLAAFKTLLFRYNSQDDCVVGVPIAFVSGDSVTWEETQPFAPDAVSVVTKESITRFSDRVSIATPGSRGVPP